MIEASQLPQKLCEGLTAYQIEHLTGESVDLAVELMKAQGLELVSRDGTRYYPQSCDQFLSAATFCIVDIETNGSKPDKHQIIEIGAVKVQNLHIIDRFESLVRCDHISGHITEITGIAEEDTQNAPTMKEVLEAFKLFLGNDIFVGHDVKFDFQFTSKMMERVGMAPLLNRSLCTIDLAERTISSYRYGLAFLNEQLELYKEATHHRALSDAMTTAKLFKRTLRCIPTEIQTVEELITFSKKAKRLKRPKFPPQPPEQTPPEA
ncbi:3'-5' exonuclease [Sulfurimonas sp. HSL1-2]|uniref:3'-5' exonuclease n=1 Tax=Thiomicrolovo zhangzhouensis TaxID=3131933 RepID=UPI0031F84DE2